MLYKRLSFQCRKRETERTETWEKTNANFALLLALLVNGARRYRLYLGRVKTMPILNLSELAGITVPDNWDEMIKAKIEERKSA